MTKLRDPENVDWELLIVNNKCTDNTLNVVKSFEGLLPIRHVTEKKQGLSHARNRAIDEARGEVIIWTDDDVLVGQNWLVEYCKGFRRHPDAIFFGGPIEPWFEIPPPKWIKSNMAIFETAFACRNLGDSEKVIKEEKDFPFGANMAVRTKAYHLFRYNPLLGRTGKNMISGEESEFFRSLVARGYSGIWVPAARVKHFIPRERLTRQYIISYFRAHGVTLARRAKNMPNDWIFVYGIPRWLIRRMIMNSLMWVTSRLTRRSDCELWWRKLQIDIGQIQEYWQTREH